MKNIDLKVARALVVEIIRNLWDRGLYRDNEWVRLCHDNWLGYWIDWRASLTMRSVDEQAKKLTPEPEIVKPIYWEEKEGESPLGGTIGFTYDFTSDDNT